MSIVQVETFRIYWLNASEHVLPLIVAVLEKADWRNSVPGGSRADQFVQRTWIHTGN